MKSLVDSGIPHLRQMKAVNIIIIWDVMMYSLVVFCASIFRVSMLKMEIFMILQGVTSQRTIVFTVTAMSTSSRNKFLFLEYNN